MLNILGNVTIYNGLMEIERMVIMEKEFDYKIKQLKDMVDAELDEESGGYGAHLSHWSGKALPIQLDHEALNVLIKHYESRNE